MIDLLGSYNYLILFLLVVIEGPIVTMLAGFFVSLGNMNFLLAYTVVVVADLVSDVFFYSVGRGLLGNAYKKILTFLRISNDRILAAEAALKKNKAKVLIFGKISHVMGVPILLASGALKIQLNDFLFYDFIATLPKSLIFLLVGYFFGNRVLKTKDLFDWTLVVLVILAILILYINFRIEKENDKNIKTLRK